MKKGIVTTIGLILLFLLASAPAYSAPNEHLDWGAQLHSGASSCPDGQKVLNVSYKIINSVDSGLGSNRYGAPWWAVIDYVLQVQVIQTNSSTFCATVKTQGNFESVGGDGPGDTGTLGAGVIGTFQGGYTENFSGTFSPNGNRTNGSLGMFDHACNPAQTNPGCSGGGVTRWLSEYFTGVSGFDFDEWWGWVYHAGNNGSWTNASTGNSGDITGD